MGTDLRSWLKALWRKISSRLPGMRSAIPHSIAPHPPADSDAGERRMERALMEKHTRHVGAPAGRE